jgi:hypothetical protein
MISAQRLKLITSLQVGFFPEKDFRPHWSTQAHNLWFRMCDVIAGEMPGLRRLHVSLRDWEMSEWRRQDRLLRPLSSLRGLKMLSIEVAEVIESPAGHKAVAISPFAETLKIETLQPRY